eukprot:CAMPEP_0184691446 /NCGR_PEP_ID=MMETSP0313-20130426/300_1 /TAXON_ID=2792 /ORGANISM="Porphyridium aerugineum, Strain SAG 1380-2" /LENGTH=511 /DNA_ID=CAMNT_0027149165 /DNA_START=483 /DNA_END=2018 /DNA_ORIENTATION=-
MSSISTAGMGIGVGVSRSMSMLSFLACNVPGVHATTSTATNAFMTTSMCARMERGSHSHSSASSSLRLSWWGGSSPSNASIASSKPPSSLSSSSSSSSSLSASLPVPSTTTTSGRSYSWNMFTKPNSQQQQQQSRRKYVSLTTDYHSDHITTKKMNMMHAQGSSGGEANTSAMPWDKYKYNNMVIGPFQHTRTTSCRDLVDNLLKSAPTTIGNNYGGHYINPSASNQVSAAEYGPRRARASVALILRVNPKLNNTFNIENNLDSRRSFLDQLEDIDWDQLEMLFIKRAPRNNDPWSGHIALPGGRADAGETDYETSIRETREEIGLDLNNGFICIGRLNDRVVRARTKVMPMSYSGFVFFQQVCNTPDIKLNPGEIDSAFWVPMDTLTTRGKQLVNMRGVSHSYTMFPALKRSIPASLYDSLSLDSAAFPGVDVASKAVESHFIDKHVEEQFALGRFPLLWGLTLSACSDLVAFKGSSFPRLDEPLIIPENKVVRALYLLSHIMGKKTYSH